MTPLRWLALVGFVGVVVCFGIIGWIRWRG